jgi:2-haloacid dehalogenase
MGRHRNFWQLTEDGLVYACNSLGLELTPNRQRRLMDACLTLDMFPDVRPGLEALKQQGIRRAILANGEPNMLRASAQHAGILALLDEIISVEESGSSSQARSFTTSSRHECPFRPAISASFRRTPGILRALDPLD